MVVELTAPGYRSNSRREIRYRGPVVALFLIFMLVAGIAGAGMVVFERLYPGFAVLLTTPFIYGSFLKNWRF